MIDSEHSEAESQKKKLKKSKEDNKLLGLANIALENENDLKS
jgi:hypothetical protein